MGREEEENLKLKEENREISDELEVIRKAFAIENISEWQRGEEDISIAELFGLALKDEEEKEETNDANGKNEGAVTISIEDESSSESVSSEAARMGTNNL